MTETLVNMAGGDVDDTCDNGDYLKIACTADSAVDDEYVYYSKDITNVSTDVYTQYLIRWKTSVSSNGFGAQASLIFTSGSQTIVGATNPEYSTTWQVTSGTITPGKTLDSIRVYANDYPDSVADGPHDVYYDFLYIFKDYFTLPNVVHGVDMDLLPREGIFDIPSKDTDSTQNLGTKSIPINIGCDLTRGNWKRPGDNIDGEVFWDILHNRSSEPWQWFNSEVGHQFKVSVHPHFYRRNDGTATTRALNLILREYSLGDKSQETYAERFGIGL